MNTDEKDSHQHKGISRRTLLASTVAAGTLAVTAGAGYVTGYVRGAGQREIPATTAVGSDTEPFFATHQAGIQTAPQAVATFLAFNLRAGSTRQRVASLMQLLTDDAARMARGRPALPDSDPYLASSPARLTFTFGFGPSLFRKLGLESQLPPGFADLPAFSIDQLRPEYCSGDLLVQVGCDDPLTLSHAARQMTRTAESFVKPLWVQRGFTRSRGVEPADTTSRNLFGQLDGTINPRSSSEFAEQVWASSGPSWYLGGTSMVLRRIAMDLDGWDKLSENEKELSVGRRLKDGAPLTGSHEFDSADFDARNRAGLKVIPMAAHIRRARTQGEGGGSREKFLRRPFSFDEGLDSNGRANVGLLFAAYMSNIARSFVPVQQRLADLDSLNKWTTPIGSAVFAIPPGCQPGGFIGEGLFPG